MSRSFYDAFPNASSSSNEDEVPSAEADIKFQVKKKKRRQPKVFKPQVEEPVIEEAREEMPEDKSSDELETATVVNETIKQQDRIVLNDKINISKAQIEYKKSDENEYTLSDSDVSIRSTKSTLFNYRAHCDQCDHFYTSCRRCMKAYRKQKEGRTRKNYIYGGKNPLIRKDILSD